MYSMHELKNFLELGTDKCNKGFINNQMGSELPGPESETDKSYQKQSQVNWELRTSNRKWIINLLPLRPVMV